MKIIQLPTKDNPTYIEEYNLEENGFYLTNFDLGRDPVKIEVNNAEWFISKSSLLAEGVYKRKVIYQLIHIKDIIKAGPFKKGEKVIHEKTAGKYKIISTPDALRIEKDNSPAYAYQSLKAPYFIYVRSAAEMEDGRFKKVE